MKDQYFGDINDYRKYGLLRCVIEAGGLKVLVAWMLTPDDGSTDGKFVTYLQAPAKWARHDPELYEGLRKLMANHVTDRHVGLMEGTGLLPGAGFFPTVVPDSVLGRESWFRALMNRCEESECDLVFLDPDNGLEVKSRSYGQKKSSKFVYWREVEALWGAGKSLLIYQHFIRESRASFIGRITEALGASTPGSRVTAFATKHVVFLLALQPEHHGCEDGILEAIEAKWAGEFGCG